jgi:ribosome-binding protein aMBF1 (putative translation factor)
VIKNQKTKKERCKMQPEKTTNMCRKILAEELGFPYWDKINLETVEKFFTRIYPISKQGTTQYWEYKENYYQFLKKEKQKVLKDEARQLLKSRIKAKARKYYRKEIEELIPSEKERRKLYNFLEVKRLQQRAKLPNGVLKHYLEEAVKKYNTSFQDTA